MTSSPEHKNKAIELWERKQQEVQEEQQKQEQEEEVVLRWGKNIVGKWNEREKEKNKMQR